MNVRNAKTELVTAQLQKLLNKVIEQKYRWMNARFVGMESITTEMNGHKRMRCVTLSRTERNDMTNYRDLITIEPDKRSGKPCIRGMRITVYDILEYLAGGMTEDEILEDFSELTREDIKACLAFAADREKTLFVA